MRWPYSHPSPEEPDLAEIQYPDPPGTVVPGPPRLARARALAERIGPQREALRELQAVPDLDGPRIRLGMAWAVLTFAAVAAGPVPLAVWFAAVALVAAGNVCRTWRHEDERPGPAAPVAVFGAAAFPIGAAFGPVGVAAVLAAVLVATVAWEPVAGALHLQAKRPLSLPLTVAVPLAIGLAAAAPVLVREIGVVEAVVLVTLFGVYDASNYLVGTGAASAWEGPAAGAAFILAVTLAVAAIFVPPFRGTSPWLFGFLTAALAPLGSYAASALLPEARAKAPALRRIDSLIVAGPIWALFALLVLS
jgi:hypothetical protein